MQKWEYKYLRLDNPEQQLNDLGEQGWELVGWDSGTTYIFKRPKAERPKAEKPLTLPPIRK